MKSALIRLATIQFVLASFFTLIVRLAPEQVGLFYSGCEAGAELQNDDGVAFYCSDCGRTLGLCQEFTSDIKN